MIFYFSWFLMVSFLIFTKKKGSNFNIILVFLMFILVYGCRDYGGVDDITYINSFYDAVNGKIVYGMENSFIYTSKFLGGLGLNYKSIFLTYATISFIFMYLSYKQLCQNKYDWMIAIIGFFVFAFIPTITIMRQFAASCISMYALINVFNKKYKRCIFFVTLASLLHASSIIVFITIPIVNKKFSEIVKIIAPIICLIIGYSGILNIILNKISVIVPSKYLGYLNISQINPDIGLLHIILITIYMLQFILPKISKVKFSTNAYLNFLENIEMIYFCMYLITLSSGWINRLSMYFILIIPFIFKTFICRFLNIKDKQILYVVCFVAYISLFTYQIIGLNKSTDMDILPYHGSIDFIE